MNWLKKDDVESKAIELKLLCLTSQTKTSEMGMFLKLTILSAAMNMLLGKAVCKYFLLHNYQVSKGKFPLNTKQMFIFHNLLQHANPKKKQVRDETSKQNQVSSANCHGTCVRLYASKKLFPNSSGNLS